MQILDHDPMPGGAAVLDARPKLRGLLHAWAAAPALLAAVILGGLASTGQARVTVAIYGAGLVLLFAFSGLYHRWPPASRVKPLLRRLDHGTIFLFIAASYTPPTVLLLDGTAQVAVLVSIWVGATAGILLSVAWIDAPRWLQAACYVGLGWVALLVLPEFFAAGGVAAGALFVLGGVLYSLGALVYATQRPDPWPMTFGFHELFHLLVIAAAAVQYVAIAIVVL
jgi:hemolysin III